MSLLASLVFAALLANLLPDVQAIRPEYCYEFGGQATKDTISVVQELVMEKPGDIDPTSQCMKPGSKLYSYHARACDLAEKSQPKIENFVGNKALRMRISCKDCGKIEVTITEYCMPVVPPSLK